MKEAAFATDAVEATIVSVMEVLYLQIARISVSSS